MKHLNGSFLEVSLTMQLNTFLTKKGRSASRRCRIQRLNLRRYSATTLTTVNETTITSFRNDENHWDPNLDSKNLSALHFSPSYVQAQELSLPSTSGDIRHRTRGEEFF